MECRNGSVFVSHSIWDSKIITFQSLVATAKLLTNEIAVSDPAIGIMYYYDNFYSKGKENVAINSLRSFGLFSIFYPCAYTFTCRVDGW